MKVDGKATRTIWLEPDGWSVGVIDQTALPHRYVTTRLTNLAEAAHAIRAMVIRGAPLIGATTAYGVCLALREDASDQSQVGARGNDGRGTQPAARRADRRRLSARCRDLRRGRRHQRRDRPQRAA